jgi:DNA polymerase III subunit chi
MKTPRVIFISVKDNNSKLNVICQTVQNLFIQKKAVLILVPNEEAASYVDQLLWRLPEESFLPHRIAFNPTNEPVVITTKAENMNQAHVLFNLCPNASPIYRDFETIYELDDRTHPTKEQLSQQRKAFYASNNCLVQ